jgi:hypothetical protein
MDIDKRRAEDQAVRYLELSLEDDSQSASYWEALEVKFLVLLHFSMLDIDLVVELLVHIDSVRSFRPVAPSSETPPETHLVHAVHIVPLLR